MTGTTASVLAASVLTWRDISLVSSFICIVHELLKHVYEEANEFTDFGARQAIDFSHVCRRFRRVALDTPVLWSSISNLRAPEEQSMRLQRAKNSGLTFLFNMVDSDYPDQSVDEFVQVLASNSHRCKRIKYVQQGFQSSFDPEAADEELDATVFPRIFSNPASFPFRTYLHNYETQRLQILHVCLRYYKVPTYTVSRCSVLVYLFYMPFKVFCYSFQVLAQGNKAFAIYLGRVLQLFLHISDNATCLYVSQKSLRILGLF